LHQKYPQSSLVLLLDSYDRDLVVNALRAEVRSLFCWASQPFKALCKWIHAVQEGQIWTNNEQLMYRIDALTLGPTLHVSNARGESLLTPREEQVLAHVAAGLPNRSIAEQLRVAESTVKKSLLRIFDKLGVSNRVELVLYALTRRDVKTQAPAIQTPAVSGPPSRSEKRPPPICPKGATLRQTGTFGLNTTASRRSTSRRRWRASIWTTRHFVRNDLIAVHVVKMTSPDDGLTRHASSRPFQGPATSQSPSPQIARRELRASHLRNDRDLRIRATDWPAERAGEEQQS